MTADLIENKKNSNKQTKLKKESMKRRLKIEQRLISFLVL